MNSTHRSAGAAALAVALLTASIGAAAAPLSYRFDMPGWTYSDDFGLYGTHAVMDVTFDNGGTDRASQTFLNGQIRSIRIRAVGGRYDHRFTAFYGDPSVSFFSTDAHGRITLDLRAGSGSEAYLSVETLAPFMQLARPGSGLGSAGLVIMETDLDAVAWTDPKGADGRSDLLVSGTFLASVPEPASAALSVAAVLALAGVRRRRAD